MGHVLLTGMTSPQASMSANNRELRMAGALYLGLKAAGHVVHWVNPELSWTQKDLETYDAVLVGIAPITSLSANRAYGALSVICHLLEDPRLRLFIDAPEPHKITSSLVAIQRTPDNLSKPFYEYRHDYALSKESANRARLIVTVEALLADQWPQTLYPVLPWGCYDFLPQMPSGLYQRLIPVSLDTLIHARSAANRPVHVERDHRWSADSINSEWTGQTAASLGLNVESMKRNKASTDVEVMERIAGSVGSLISPVKGDHTWWSPRYVQSLATFTPVVSAWRETQVIGESWRIIGPDIESYSQPYRNEVASAQAREFFTNVPDYGESVHKLSEAVGLAQERKTNE